MALILLRRPTTFTSLLNPQILLIAYKFSSTNNNEPSQYTQGNTNKGIPSTELSPLFSKNATHVNDYKVELVDNETWRVSTALSEAWRGLGTKAIKSEVGGEAVNCIAKNFDDPNFDEIEDMRIRGNLFYKLDRDSKEYEEYSFDFHRKKSWKNKGSDRMECKTNEGVEKSSNLMNKDARKESQKDNSSYKFNKTHVISVLNEMDSNNGKKLRTPTFNQLTDPYHEPFCLDIYISKASVRACIVHRATSNVVAVAHSISKDMKFDLGSTRNATACKAVGEVLAQRALADDIHNVVYTPRKGDKLEGKLQIVLDSLITNGVNVKVKIKQRNYKKARLFPPA